MLYYTFADQTLSLQKTKQLPLCSCITYKHNHAMRSYFFRPKLIRLLLARPRLALCTIIGFSVALALPSSITVYQNTRLLIGWNTGVILYLLFTGRFILRATHATIKSQARQEDEGRFLILFLAILVAIWSLTAIINELAITKTVDDYLRYTHLALIALTLFSSWSFIQAMFALHYAHDYYAAEMRQDVPGLAFPGEEAPDYSDFLYFACIIGTSAQTADVNFTNRTMRRTGTVHCIFAFFFNTILLALTINMASGLF